MSMENFIRGTGALKVPDRVPRPEPKKPSKPKLELVKTPVIETLADEDVQPDTEAENDNAEELTGDDIIESVPHAANDNAEAIEAAEVREPGELQLNDVVPPFEVHGFSGVQVVATLEKKNSRKGKDAERNEDNIIADPETGIVGVLDGLGSEGEVGAGAKASMAAEAAIPAAYTAALAENRRKGVGDIAGQIVGQQLARLNIADPGLRAAKLKELSGMFEEVVARDPELGRKAAALVESIRRANEAVLATGDEKTRGKTTACIGMVHKGPDGKSYAIVASIGDSVAFKRRGSTGEMIPLTEEDSLLSIMKSAGAISAEQLAMMKSEPKKKFNFPISLELVQALGGSQVDYEGFQAKGITQLPLDYGKLKRAMSRSMGANSAEASLTIREMKPGDELIIATDVFDNFENTTTEEPDLPRMAQVAGGAGSQSERVARLREEAKKGPKDDDAALVSAKVL